MNVLVACEESQRVCAAFRAKGHNAFSCDIQEPSGGHPEWHIKGDVLQYLNGRIYGKEGIRGLFYGIHFHTVDGTFHDVERWDLIIAHPPCTYLTVTGNRWFNVQKYGEKALERRAKRVASYWFFMQFVHADCDKIAIENPIGYMNTHYRKPDQIIHPYMFGDPARKATCLWLKGLPLLIPTNVVEPEIIKYKNGKGTDNPWHIETIGLDPAERSRLRSQKFPGISRAMAEQWG